MYKARVFLVLGTWMIILPFLGLPYSWKDILVTLTGLVVVCFSYVLYKDYKKLEKKQGTFDNFRENSNFGGAKEEK